MENKLNELDKLEVYLRKNGYNCVRIDEEHQICNRHQIIVYKDGKRSWDAICQRGSYGYEKGLLEVMGSDILGHDEPEGMLTAKYIIAKLEMTSEKAIEILNAYDVNFEGYASEDIVAAFSTVITALNQIPQRKDCISRMDAIKAIQNLYPKAPRVKFFGAQERWEKEYGKYIECEMVIHNLPIVRPDENVGEWKIYKRNHNIYKCSVCDNITKMNVVFDRPMYKYCPYCRARMKGIEG